MAAIAQSFKGFDDNYTFCISFDDNNEVLSHCVHQIFVSEKVKRVNAEKCKQNLNVTPMRRDKSDKDQTEI